MEKNERAKTDWEELKQVYKQWQQFMSKSKVKMKKKIKKDKKEYYDFDYTRGQYYYNFPEYHINFAPPEVQKNFFKDVLQQQTKPISNVYYSECFGKKQIEDFLQPQQLHDFLKDIRKKFHREITTLRIQKSFYIRQTPCKPQVVDFMEDQIRSFNCRLMRFQNVYFTFQKSLSQRLEDRTTTLKMKKFDEMHFSQLEKGDFVVYLRMQGAKQRLVFQSNRLFKEIELSLLPKKWDIIKKCYERRGSKIKEIQKIHGQKYIQRKNILDKHFIQNDPIFFDSDENLKVLENYLQCLNYTRQINKSKVYFDVNISLKQLDYIPSSELELKELLFSVCEDYFPRQMMENLYTHKKEHLCYRLNYFGSIILRAIVESYNFVIQIKEKDLHSMRNTMKRQLQTIFTNQADKLFNIMEHQIICLLDQGPYDLPYYPKVSCSQSQNIFKDYFKINKLIDPFTKSIVNLLSISNDKTIKEVVDNYVAWIQEIIPNKLRYLSLYYKNFHNDRKNHLINLLNAKLAISAFSNSLLEQKFDGILNKDQKIDEGLTRITYLLYAINCIQIKRQLENIVSAQISIMYKIKHKLNLLEYKHNIPFQMSSEFLGRFSQSSNSFDFLAQGQIKNTIPYPDMEINDKIFRMRQGGNREKIQVRRIIPENPLFQGKRILYHEAVKQTNQILDKIHNVCAFMIEQRQNYLHEQKFSGIVDRFRLVNNLLKMQIGYHNQKLKYMEQLFFVFDHTINPEGLFLIASQIYEAKYKEVYIQLNQPHFEQIYVNQTELWTCKYNILSKMRVKQMKFQNEEKTRFRQSLMKNNHINNLPEISSIYYSDELAMEADDNIVEEAEDESMSEVISQSQFVMNSSKYRSDISGISSEYHVKTTFKQILGRNSINSQAIDLSKREELMGRKKKKLLNDSVLGGILIYDQCRYYRYIHQAIVFMKKLENLFEETFQNQDSGIKKQFYQSIDNIIDVVDQNPIKDVNLIDQNMLNKHLADCSRAISKVIEKYKLGPSSLDQYTFFNSRIFKDFLQNNNFTNLNDLRGLYTCLNIVKLYKDYPKYLQNTFSQRHIVKQLGALAKKYSSQQLSKETKFVVMQNLNLKYDFGAYLKTIDAPAALSASKSLLFLSNNGTFTNVVFASTEVITNYYQSLLKSYYEQIFDYKSFLTNLELIQLYGTYFDSKILSVIGIQNRLSIRRKIQSTIERLGRLYKTKNIEEFISLPHACLDLIKKQEKKVGSNQAQLLQNIQMFEDFVLQLASALVLISTATQKIHLKSLEKKNHEKMEKFARILPYVSTKIQVKSISDSIYRQMFQESFKGAGAANNSYSKEYYSKQSYSKQSSRQQPKLIQIQFKKISFQNLAKNVFRDSLTDVKKIIRHVLDRKHKEFTMAQRALEKYYDYLDVKRYQQPYRLDSETQLKDIFDYYSQINRALNLATWIQCKILLFGASLKPEELIYFRCILLNISENSEMFFRDESSRLVNYYDITKMKLDNVDSHSTSQRYINSFLNYENLKMKYKNFLDSLAELDINNEGRQIINIMYVGNKALFRYCNNSLPDYLNDYCSLPKIKNEANYFIQFVVNTNPNRYLSGKHARILNFSLLKTFIWDFQNKESFKKQAFFLEERCQVIKQILNSNNNKMKDMTQELSIQLYTRQRMRQIHEFLKIPINKRDRIQYAFFLKKLQQNLLLGIDKLNPIQKYLSKFIEKILKEKPQLVNLKDQIIEKIYETRFYEELILTKLSNMSTAALNRELKLYQILFENYHQRELIRENKIIKNTMNKVLVPKIIINPYLQSPLIIENYFFAAALKLSYIDNFLNKLKNRAILVELAEGGFGFLLKITELDECIQLLCKGVITFTEKEFSDRFRTFIEAHDQLKQKYKKSLNTNQTLRNMVNICREEWGKEIKSVIYSKLNSYIGTIHSKEKSYQSIFNIVKSLQLQIAKKIDLKYEQRIKSLQEQNKKLKEQFIQYRMITQRNARTSMEESKDMLYNNFKKEVESILNKEVVKDYKETGEKEHQQQEEYMSSLLLKKLRKQKIFYQMKICNMEAKLREKSNQINKLKQQLITIQNTLASDQFKNSKLSQEIKRLFDKNIEIEQLKRQINKKEQQQTLNRLKLIKVNEHLQGRITRLEEKSKFQANSLQRQVKKQEKDMGIQAVFLTQKRQRRNFKIKTEYSQQHTQQQPIKNLNRVDEVPIWREKWEHSERKYHILMSKIIQAYQVYRMNKNGPKLIDRIGQIFQECINNQVLRKK